MTVLPQLTSSPIDLMGGLRSVIFRLVAATLIGAAVGLNRELRHKPAGLRTHALVGLGAALVTVTAVQLTFLNGVGDGAGCAKPDMIAPIDHCRSRFQYGHEWVPLP